MIKWLYGFLEGVETPLLECNGKAMNIGAKLKQLRLGKGLTQDELGTRCDLSKGFISQVERDLTSPSITTLMDILESLGTNLKNFFNEVEEEQIVYKNENIFETNNEELKYNLKWLIPNAQKNMMEPILLTIEGDGRYIEEEAHEGEEFGYVLSGFIYLYIGNEKYKVKKGESFYFKADSNHYIANTGKVEASFIWVSTPPNF